MPTIMEFAEMASQAYETSPSVSGWSAAQPAYDASSGLRSVVFSKGSTKVLAFRGTAAAGDLVEDAELTLGMNTAMYPVGETRAANAASPSSTLYVTGHSLGGAVAQVVGKRMEVPFVTFNAPGVALVASQNILTANPHAVAARMVGAYVGATSRPMQALRDLTSAFNSANGENYRLSVDVVSATGVHYGDVITLPAGTANPLTAHYIATMIAALQNSGTDKVSYPR